MTAKRPDDVSEITNATLDVLERYTMFPWPLLKTQAEKLLLDPKQLDADGLSLCVDEIHAALNRFTSAEKADRAATELRDLAFKLG